VKVEAWIFTILAIFCAIVTPVYYVMSRDPTGTAALILTFFLVLMIGLYLGLLSRRIDPRPEDQKQGEIAQGAGELGFFPPSSIWPLFCALTLVLVALAPVFGWWLLILGAMVAFITVTGWIFEFYRGDHAH
jgi:Cytochrome c oxidase subunit IV